jgi:protein-S-isoprenylcysteine O-methyltransferase Ste14
VHLLSPWHAAILAWLIFLLYWTVSAVATKPSVKRESVLGRAPQMVLVVIGALLIFRSDTRFQILHQRFIPKNSLLADGGVLLTWTGIAIAIWARYHIGQYWSGRVTLKEDHQLIRTGPYARMRHPIYSGIALALLGTALVVGELRALIGVCLITSAHLLKARKEEAWLTIRFGRIYEDYRRRTGFLFPRMRGVP